MITKTNDRDSFWQEVLTDAPPVLALPLDLPRPPISSFLRGTVTVSIENELRSQLAAHCEARHLQPSTVLLAAFQVLLTRYSNQDDILFWYLGNGHRSDSPSPPDLFPWRTKTQLTFVGDDVINRTAELLAESAKHLSSFDSTAVDLLALAGGAVPQGKVAFVESASQRELAHQAEEFLSSCDVVVEVEDVDGESRVNCEYDQEVLGQATVSRMLGHLLRLLGGMLASGDVAVGQLPMLADDEFKQLIGHGTPSAVVSASHCVHELFEKQAEKSPDAIALTCGDDQLTYAELNRRANFLARKLRDAGVGRNDLVGLYLERNNDLVVAILAVAKSGGAYLPIDLAFPPERAAFMLADSRTVILLTSSSLQADLPDTGATVLNIDETLAAAGADAHPNLPPLARGEDLAYVIYTSGTTGKPKGALVTHHNVARLFSATDRWFGFNDQDVWTLFHSCAFDFSVWEIWGALLYGGRLIVIPFSVSRAPETFYELLAGEQVTVLNQTPSAFRQLIAAEESVGAKPLALRYVIFGGEVLGMETLRGWFDRHGDEQPQLVNMYGITETTVHVTYRPLTRRDVGGGSVIGKPIPDLRIYILEPGGQPAPIGVPGELYVGGAGVCRGYLGRDELTAKRFIEDPFTAGAGLLYRTGDLACWKADGDIEYLGRIDDQVKIRGFRIELQEIETVLLSHRSVRQCAVVAREDQPGDKRLVAYVVRDDRSSESVVSELRNHLKRRLPDYMIPAAFVVLEELPLTGNGKINRRALPAPTMQRPRETPLQLPMTQLEETIAAYWQAALNIDQVGVHDNFFELGGHSLILAEMHKQLRDKGFAKLELVDLYNYPTIRSLVDFLLDQKQEASLDAAQDRARKQLAAVKRRGHRQVAKGRSRQ